MILAPVISQDIKISRLKMNESRVTAISKAIR